MHRVLLLAGMLIAQVDGANAAVPRMARTVQLIPMGNMPSDGETARPSATVGAMIEQFGGQPDEHVVAGGPDRRHVAIQMMDSFVEQGAGDKALPDQADLGGPRGLYSHTDAMAIPSWMTGGPLTPSAPSRWAPGCLPMSYRPAGFLTADAEIRRQGYYDLMSQIACDYGIPVGLFDAMIIQESRYRHHVFSSKNAYGLTQLMPGTAAELGVDRYAVDQNLRGGAHYLRQQLDRFGQVHLALAAYNAGPGRVRGGMIPPIRQTRLYVDDILHNWSRLSGLAMPGWRRQVPQTWGEVPGEIATRRTEVSTF